MLVVEIILNKVLNFIFWDRFLIPKSKIYLCGISIYIWAHKENDK